MNSGGPQKNRYDVIIVGAGIGGLVCGCYLTRVGLKVLIVEQHHTPGGYCTSFKRKGYTFDAAVHYLGSCREKGGIIYSILDDLSLLNRINFLRNDPCEKIITPGETIYIREDSNGTREELINCFPREKNNIEEFFDFILKEDFLSLVAKTRNLTFDIFLNKFFDDYKLKTILSIPLGNLGLAPSRVSALAAIFLYREYITDGGYYPEGGIQTFPDLLAARFEEYGGELLLSKKVKRIIVGGDKITGIKLDDGKTIETEQVVSNADAISTFSTLISSECEEKAKVRQLEISPSAFIVYLGIKRNLEELIERHYATWLFSTYDLERCYDTRKYYDLERYRDRPSEFNIDYLICHFPSLVDRLLAPKDCSVVRAMFWVKADGRPVDEEFKNDIYKKVILMLNEIIPNIQESIEVSEIAVPQTLNKFTFNHNGSALGWASTVGQVDKNVFPGQTSIPGLSLTGHWVTNGIGHSGIPLVAFCGRNTANYLINQIGK